MDPERSGRSGCRRETVPLALSATLNFSQQRRRRAAEREGRRVRSARAREAQHQGLAQPRNLVHHDGKSTDDEQPDADRLSFDKERELILDDARYVFEYVTEQLSSVAALKQKFARWKRDFGESYVQAYIPLCLVKLLKPASSESCGWDDALLFYGEDTTEDPDLCLLPRIVERVVLPKMSALEEKSRHLQNFIAKVAARVSRALDEDVYIPLYPRELVTLLVFFVVASHILLSLQGVGEQLMKNGLSWQGLLTEEPLKELSLCSLLNRYLIVALQAGLSQRVEKC
ncbi:hypothetical protein MRX96_013703 [Rhipicephalus microplus]